VSLPFAIWAQPAVLSVPVTDATRVAKAVTRRTSSLAELLGRAPLRPAELAQRLEIDPASVDLLLSADRATPAVMLDGEDAAVGDPATVGAAFAAALSRPDWPSATLCLLRVAAGSVGISQLRAAAARLGPAGRLPDSVVLAKGGDHGDVTALVGELERWERSAGVGAGHLGVHLLIESAAGLTAVEQLAEAARDRLAGLVFGPLDYAADVGLPDADDHANPTFSAARTRLVEVAAVAGVPAIDGMTLAFPGRASDTAAPGRLLDALAKTFDDALRAARQGMAGKLVGHPAQLLAVLLAYGEVYSTEQVGRWRSTLDAYAGGGHSGAMIHDGRMVDAASVRQARTMLGRAQAAGYAVRPADRIDDFDVAAPAARPLEAAR
jgi:citrate lyase beta subunit